MTIKSLLVKIGCDTTELQANLSKAEGYIKKHEAKFRAVGQAMTVVGGAMTAFFALAVKQAAIQEASEVRLEAALKNVKTATEGGAAMLIRYAGALQKVTGYGDEEIISAQAMLATFQLNEKQIAAITPRLLDMAAATEKATGEKQDLQAIAIALGKGFTGQAGQLARYGVVLGEEAKKTGDFNAILKDLDMNFKGAAAAAGQTFTGQMRIMKASLGDAAETLGAKLMPALLPLVQKITEAAGKIKDWIDAHQGLVRTLVPIIAGLGAVLTILGPIVMILPKVVSGIMAVGKAFVFLATNPIGIVVAALGIAAAMFLRVKDAQLQAEQAAKREAEVTGKFKEKLWSAAEAAGYTKEQFEKLTEKYHGNVAALGMAIQKGKEGTELQKSLAEVGKKHKETIEDQKKAMEGFAASTFTSNKAMIAAEAALEKIVDLKRQMSDETAKATMKEREYQKWALGTAYEERQAQIKKEVSDERVKGELLAQAKQSYLAQLAVLEKQFRDEDLQAKIAFAQQVRDQEAQLTLDRIEALKIFATQKQAIHDSMNQLVMSELEYKRWALDQEQIAEAQRIADSKELTEVQKEELLSILDDYYTKKREKAEEDASGWTELVENTTGAITSVMGNLFSTTMDAFRKWGEEGGNILTSLGEAFKTTVNTALDALRDLVTGTLLASMKEILAAKAVAIAHAIKSVMASIPFPLNLALVGGAIAAVSRLFSGIKLAEGGIVTRPTMALVGERGPEAVIPLDKMSGMAFAGAGVTLRQANYFYGSINNAGDLDEISRRLAERTMQAISKGRK